METRAPKLLELDLADLAFMDARGVAVLLRAYHAGEKIDCRIRLLRPAPHVRRVLTITGVSTVCELVE